jgi:hypothetical protein
MAKAGNSSSEETPLSQRQAEHNFNEAARHCYEIIFNGRSVKTVDQPRWAYETGRWSEFVRPGLDKAFVQCERAGMHAGDLRERIETLDAEYRLVCKLRNDISSKSATPAVDPCKTGAPGRPNATHIVIAEAERRIASGEVIPKPNERAKFSRDLAAWWETKRHEYAGPPLKFRSINNKLRELWNRALRGA